MANDNLKIGINAELDRAKSKVNIANDLKALENTPFYIRLIALLNKSLSIANINRNLQNIQSQVQNINVAGQLNTSVTRRNINRGLNNIGNNTTVNVNARINPQSTRTIRASLQNNPVNIPVNVNGNINTATNQLQQLNQQAERSRNIFTNYLQARDIFRIVTRAIRETIDTVEELNEAQTNLQIATSKSATEMQSLMSDYNDLAKEMSSTTLDVTSAADDYLRQGQSVADTNTLIRDSLILAKIGELDSAQATEYLTSAMKGYQQSADDVLGIIDKLAAVDLKSASSAGELAESMSRTANTARLAGVDMDTLIAYIATVKDVTQDSAESIGNSFKTIFTRLTNVKLNKFVDEDGNDITQDINDAETVLNKFGISLRNNAKEFRNAEDIIADVAGIWNELGSVDQAAIRKGFANTYQAEKLTALFENYNKVLELTETSQNSAGTAMEKFAIYEQSLDAATNRLKSSLEGLAYNTLDSNFLIGLADGTARIVEFVDSTKLLQTGLTAGMFTGIISGLVTLGTRMTAVKNNVVNFTNAIAMTKQTSALTATQFQSLQSMATGLNTSQVRLLVSSKNLTDTQRVQILMARGMSQEEANAQLQTWGLMNAQNAATGATFSLRNAWETLKISIASNPIGLIVTALTTATMAISTYNQKQREAQQEAVEMADRLDEEQIALNNLKQEYINIVDSEDSVAKKTEELNKWKETLIETYGFEKEALEDVNLEREKGLELLDAEMIKNRINSAETWLTENNSQYEDAVKKVRSGNNQSGTIYVSNVVDNVTKDKLQEYSDNFADIIDQLYIKNPTKNNPLAQIQIEGSNALQQYENLKEVLNDITSIKVTKGLNEAETELYNSLLKKEKEYKKVLTDDIIDIYETGNKYTNMIKLFEFETDEGIGFNDVTQKNYKDFRDKFLESMGYGLKKDSTDFALDIEQILLEMLPEYEKAYRGIEDISAESTDIVIDDLNDIANAASDTENEFELVAKKVKLITTAMEDMNDTGYISSSTYADIVEMGGNFSECLEIQNGKIKLNIEKLKEFEIQQYKNKIAANELALADPMINSASDYWAYEEKRKELEKENAIYQTIIDEINNAQPKETSSGGGTSTKTEKPKQVTDFESKYAEYQHEINMGRKKEDADYYDWLESEAHKAYDGLEDYQSDLWKYEEEVYKGRKQLEEDLLEEKENALDEHLDYYKDRIEELENSIDKANEGKIVKITNEDVANLERFNKEMQKTYGLGNVDLTKRPQEDAETMRKSGYDVEDGSTATVYSTSQFVWQGDEENGKYVVVHYTPILPDGTVLDADTLDNYIYDALEGSDDILQTDKNGKGIVLKVDSNFDITEEDMRSLESGNYTENIQNIIALCDDWDVKLHEVQEEWVELDRLAKDSANSVESIDTKNFSPAEKFNYIRSVYDEILNNIEAQINEIIQSGLDGHEDELKELEKQYEEYLDKKNSVFEDEVQYEIDYIENLQDKLSDEYDERIDKIESEKDAVEERYDTEIDKIDETIDALQKKNDENQLALDIEQARQDLENAKQKTRKVYGADGTI